MAENQNRLGATSSHETLRASLIIVFSFFILVFRLWPAQSIPQGGDRVGQWTTFGHDPQRSGWAADEHTFTRETMAHLRLAWKATLPNEPRALNGLTAPLVVGPVATADGLKTLVIVAGSSDHVFALDAEDGTLIWQVDFPALGKPRNPGDWLCPNALNATPVIDTAGGRVFVISSDGRLHTLALRDGGRRQAPVNFVPPYSKMWSLNYVGGLLYTTLSQDCNGARSGIYVMNPDTPGHPVTAFWSEPECGRGFCGAGIWGRAGASVDFAGFVYGATGDGPFDPAAHAFGSTVLRLAPGLSKLADYYTPPNWQQINKLDLDMSNSTPVLFRWRDRVLAAAGGKEGVIYVMDTSAMGGADHHSAVYVSPRYSNDEQIFQKNGIWGSMSTWQDAVGNVWLYVPTWGPVAAKAPAFPISYDAAPHGSVMAFKVAAGASGKPVLQPAWISRDISVPEPVAIAGGVVFALGSGENTDQVYNGDIHRLIKDRGPIMTDHAILFALDGETGRELWNSGMTITDWTHFSGLAVGAGKVFAVTHHGGVYAFGLASRTGAPSPMPMSARPAPMPSGPPHVVAPASSATAGGGDASGCASTAEVFAQKCSMCHGPDGKGLAAMHTPDFTDSKWQAARTDTALIDAIINGKEGEGRMPAFKDKLTDEQVKQLVRCTVRGATHAHGEKNTKAP